MRLGIQELPIVFGIGLIGLLFYGLVIVACVRVLRLGAQIEGLRREVAELRAEVARR